MLSRFSLRLLAVVAILFAFAQADLADVQQRDELAPRQLSDGLSNLLGGTSTSPTKSGTTSKSPTSTDSSTSKSSPSVTPTVKDSTTTTPPTSTPTSNTSASSTTPPNSTPTQSSDTTTPPPPTSTSKSTTNTKDTSSVSRSESVVVVKQTTTIDGVAVETEVSSTSTAPAPTGTDSTVNKGSETTNKGMSSSTKKTVIGVVVGIVGAIVLGALFFVAWRIWGRKKSEDEGDDLMSDYHGRSAHEKTTSDVSGAAPSPFQTTLDQYHNPTARNANVSSNF